MRMGAFDNHIASGINVNAGRVARIGLHQPDDDRNVVGDALEGHGNGAVCLEEVDRPAVVVCESSGFRLEAGEGVGERDEVLTD